MRPRVITQSDDTTRGARTYELGEAYWVYNLPHQERDHDGNAMGFISSTAPPPTRTCASPPMAMRWPSRKL